MSRISSITDDTSTQRIERHKTAIRRPSFSLPVKCAIRDSLLDSTRTFFDYGCGHGRDLKFLKDLQIESAGWDPKFAPHQAIHQADVVNIGYVINVIEDVRERTEALKKAWSICESVLIVAAQIEFAAPDKELATFNDGVITSRGTFQKYYNQHELRGYIESELGHDAVSAAPGVFYVFKCEETKQQFVASRYHRRISVPRRKISEVLFEENKDILEPFMVSLTRFGRIPAIDELPEATAIIERFGSLKRAFKLVQKVTDESPWEELAQRRTEDLLVYLALSRFRQRPPISKLPATVQRDIKEFFGGYNIACGRADTLLFRAGDPIAIDEACQRANVGVLVDNALIFHKSCLEYLEPLLRIYEGCARALVGELDDANVIKLHRFSGKITYLAYSAFDKAAHPELRQRIKVTLPNLCIDFFDYSEWDDSPVLDRKDCLIHQSDSRYKRFAKLTHDESKCGLFDGLPQVDSRAKLETKLAALGLRLQGHRVIKTK